MKRTRVSVRNAGLSIAHTVATFLVVISYASIILFLRSAPLLFSRHLLYPLEMLLLSRNPLGVRHL